jgi:hypothetical protein
MSMPTRGYQPKSPAGRAAMYVFIAACFITLIVVFIVKH